MEKSETLKTAGIIEGTEVNLSSEVSGNISYMCCKEGDSVKEGEIVFKLESHDLKALVEQAQAAVKKAKAGIMVSKAQIENSRANIKSSEADIKTAEADTEKASVQDICRQRCTESSPANRSGKVFWGENNSYIRRR